MREERRTIAMRPGSASYTPPSSAAVVPCLNCGMELKLAYCPNCGQRAIDPDPTLREFAGEAAEEFLHWDGKLVGTFRLLLTRPGALTEEYLAGRRVQFIPPLRLYLLCSVLFFFVNALVPDHSQSARSARGSSLRLGPLTVGETNTPATLRALDAMAHSPQLLVRAWGVHYARAIRNPARFAEASSDIITRVMFVLVPAFAWLTGLVMRGRRRRYPQHVAYALHTHAFIFLAILPMLVPRVATYPPVRVAIVLASVAAIAAYLVASLRRVYQLPTREAVLRALVLGSGYFLVFFIAMLAAFATIVLAVV